MKSVKSLLNRLDIKSLLSYLCVGFGATAVEWIFFWIFDAIFKWHYSVSTTLAIIISTFSNWLFGRLWTFKNSERGNIVSELIKIYIASVVGLLLNLLFMWIFIDIFHINEMFSKVISTGIVFFYNYLVRILFIYKKK